MKALAKNAILKADQIRMILGLNMYEPVDIIGACEKLGILVVYVNVSMEGLYYSSEAGGQPKIILSCLRPLPRRFYTCAHELGHHTFGHGTKLDSLSEQIGQKEYYDEDELVADSFAGSFLMPVIGLQSAFIKRKWNFESALPIDFYKISSVYSVGFHTLIHHCRINQLISSRKASDLLSFTPIKIFRQLFHPKIKNSYFKIIDTLTKVQNVDLEVTNYIILPRNVLIDRSYLKKVQETSEGVAYEAICAGKVLAHTQSGDFNTVIRIQNFRYSGFSENRYLENINE